MTTLNKLWIWSFKITELLFNTFFYKQHTQVAEKILSLPLLEFDAFEVVLTSDFVLRSQKFSIHRCKNLPNLLAIHELQPKGHFMYPICPSRFLPKTIFVTVSQHHSILILHHSSFKIRLGWILLILKVPKMILNLSYRGPKFLHKCFLLMIQINLLRNVIQLLIDHKR